MPPMSNPALNCILIVDDHPALGEALSRAFERRGIHVRSARSTDEALEIAPNLKPHGAVVDLKLETGSGLVCVQALHQMDADMRIVVLTGFASISTAVEAIKLGACHYLAKPANADDILKAMQRVEGLAEVPLSARPTSLKNLEWERIHEVLAETGFNVSETARRLGYHRRTLVRKLAKKPLN